MKSFNLKSVNLTAARKSRKAVVELMHKLGSVYGYEPINSDDQTAYVLIPNKSVYQVVEGLQIQGEKNPGMTNHFRFSIIDETYSEIPGALPIKDLIKNNIYFIRGITKNLASLNDIFKNPKEVKFHALELSGHGLTDMTFPDEVLPEGAVIVKVSVPKNSD